MEPEGTSRDDLDVRLRWPGAEPERAAEIPSARADNGAPREGHLSNRPSDGSSGDGSKRSAPESEFLEVAVELITARLDVLTNSLDKLRSAVEDRPRVDRGVSDGPNVDSRIDEVLSQLASLADRQLETAPVDRTDELLQRLTEIGYQMEALRRRITLRARADYVLPPEAVDRIVEGVVERLSTNTETPSTSARPQSREGGRRR